MRKLTILLLLLTLCISTAAFADSGQLGSGARTSPAFGSGAGIVETPVTDSPMVVGSGVGDGPTYGSGVGDSPMLGAGVGDTPTMGTSGTSTSVPLRSAVILQLVRLFLGV